MTRTKATVRRMSVIMPARIGNKNILKKRLRVMPFKTKRILPEMKKVSVKKNGQTVREMNVRQKSTYFYVLIYRACTQLKHRADNHGGNCAPQ